MGKIIPIVLIEKRATQIKSEINQFFQDSNTDFINQEKELPIIVEELIKKATLEKKKHEEIVSELKLLIRENEYLINNLKQKENNKIYIDETKTVLINFNNFILKSIDRQNENIYLTIDFLESSALKEVANKKSHVEKVRTDLLIKQVQLKIITYLLDKHKISSPEIKTKINEELTELISAIDTNKFQDFIARKIISSYNY